MHDVFLKMIDDAHKNVHKTYRGAELLTADRDLTKIGTPWKMVFEAPTAPGGAVLLEYIDGMGFKIPQPMPRPVGVRPIHVPLLLALDKAEELVKKQGVPSPYMHIALDFVLNPNVTEPHYVFQTVRDVAFVGTHTKTVEVVPADVFVPVPAHA
ncbi:MAG TPA: hypothetical protein VEZ11_18260 [Thermoanaerobaculia bacterium]|nr:hypothetical protein [Thermoanaerobaculia bacterium]